MELGALVTYLDEFLKVPEIEDYPNAMNGLQVSRKNPEVNKVALAVDSGMATLQSAATCGADVLVVHHGLFWGGLQAMTGRLYEKMRVLLDADLALYSVHLPLDAHPGVGHAAALSRPLELQIAGPFGDYKGHPVGWHGFLRGSRQTLQNRLIQIVDGPVTCIPGGPDETQRVAIVTGSGGSFIEAAAAEGIDTLISGEGGHHTYHDAMEFGVNVFYAGHYATETFGMKALGKHIEIELQVEWEFLDHPTGL